MYLKFLFVLNALLIVNSAIIELPPLTFPSTNQLNLTQLTANYREIFYDQTLDHFNFNDERTFQQRFLLHG